MSSELPQQEFEIGDPVEVLMNQRNGTGRTGLIARAIWHHKDACYNYYLEVDGKQVSKRYVASDLMRVPSNNSFKPNPLRGSA
jgi:ATP-dependent 26S proteasome regulatory subunit